MTRRQESKIRDLLVSECLGPPQFMYWNLHSQSDTMRRWDLWEVTRIMYGMNYLIKGAQGRPFLYCEVRMRRWLSVQTLALMRCQLCPYFQLTLSTPEWWKAHVWHSQASQSVVFCFNSLNELRQDPCHFRLFHLLNKTADFHTFPYTVH